MNEMTEKPVQALQDPRVYLAAERTLLAWIRTGLSLMGFGFVVARFGLFLREMAVADAKISHRPHSASLWIGVTLVAAGVIVNVLAAVDHLRTVRALRRGDVSLTMKSNTGAILAAFLALIGAIMAGYLLWVGQDAVTGTSP